MKIKQFISQQLKLSEVTKKDYEKDIRAFENYSQVKEPSAESVYSYIEHLKGKGRGNSHISRVLYSLKRYCKWAGIDIFGDGKIEVPGFEIREPKGVPTIEDIKKLMASANTPLEKVIIAILFDTACRIGELLKLKKEDVDWDKGIIYLTRKGRRERREAIAVFPETIKIMKDYKKWSKSTEDRLFPFEYGELRIWMIKLAKRAGVVLPRYSLFHSLRHSRAVTMRVAGIPLEVIADQLGHKSVTTTQQIYARFTPEQLKAKVLPPPWEK